MEVNASKDRTSVNYVRIAMLSYIVFYELSTYIRLVLFCKRNRWGKGLICAYDVYESFTMSNLSAIVGVLIIGFIVWYSKFRAIVLINYKSRLKFLVKNVLIMLRELMLLTLAYHMCDLIIANLIGLGTSCNWEAEGSYMRAVVPINPKNMHVYPEYVYYGVRFLSDAFRNMYIILIYIAVSCLISNKYATVATVSLLIYDILARENYRVLNAFVLYNEEMCRYGLDIGGWRNTLLIMLGLSVAIVLIFKRKNVLGNNI